MKHRLVEYDKSSHRKKQDKTINNAFKVIL